MSASERHGSASADTRERGPVEQLLLAGIGWASLGAGAADQIAEDLARKVGVDVDEMRRAIHDTLASWRMEAERLGERRGDVTDRVVRQLGLVRREEIDDLELRVAQLEHRVKLLES